MFTHYSILTEDGIDSKRTHLFTLDKCERCGKVTQGVNALGGVVNDIPKYKRLGMVEWTDGPLDEMGYSDAFGGAVCQDCYRAAENDAEVSS